MEYLGKKERLRKGEFVELKPGTWGRLNKENRTLELDSGKVLPIGKNEQRDLFPESEEALDVARKKEELESEIKSRPFGEFLFQLGNQGPIGGVKDWTQKFINTGDQYLRTKQAESEVGQRISEESPWTSGAATVASMVPDIMLTKGMSAAKAAPIITGLSAGSRILEEPGQVAAEAALSSAGGAILDKGAKYLQKVADRRGAVRALPAQAENVRLSNAARELETQEANRAAKEAFRNETEWANRENSARMHQYNLELADRQNKLNTAKSAYEEAKATHSANVGKLKEKASLEQKSYDEAIKKLPQLQAQAQKEFSEGLGSVFKEIEESFPKGTKIPTNDLKVWNFYNDYIRKNGLVSTPESRQTQQLIRSLFPNNNTLSSKEFIDRLRAIESAIGNSSPESQRLLLSLKNHLVTTTPPILGESILARSIVPLAEKAVQKEIGLIFRSKPFENIAVDSQALNSYVKQEMKKYISSSSNKELAQNIKSGQFLEDIRNKVLPFEKFQGFITDSSLKSGLSNGTKKLGAKTQYHLNNFEKSYESFLSNLATRSENAIARAELELSPEFVKHAATAKGQLTRKLKKTAGMAEPVPMPQAPEPIAFPEAPSMPNFEALPLPAKPSSVSAPQSPVLQQFTPQEIPTMPAPMNAHEAIGDLLEKPLLQQKIGMNKLLKLGALKYALGPAAAPIEAALAGAYGAGKILTSPGAIGDTARLSFKVAGVQAIDHLARKYPTYHDGILENPQERRSLNKEIEDNPEIPLEQKAVLQSKINRGKSIFEKL